MQKLKPPLKATSHKLKAMRGFTLIELLVSISIIGVLSSLVMVNTGFGSRQKNLQRAAQQLALDIRRAQNLSLAPSDSPICYYGLKINSASDYFLYKNAASSCAGGYVYSGNPSDKVDANNVSFQGGVTVSNYSASMDMAFSPPEPITYLEGTQNNQNVQGVPGNTVMTITLRSSDGTTKNVITNRFGQVEIQ